MRRQIPPKHDDFAPKSLDFQIVTPDRGGAGADKAALPAPVEPGREKSGYLGARG